MADMQGTYIKPYSAACIQNRPRIIDHPDHKDEVIQYNLDRILQMIDYATSWGRSNVRLVVTPEYAINPPARPIPREPGAQIAAGMTIPSKWTDMLAAKAQERNIFICANVLEVDPEWPGRYFNTSFILNPSGDVILKHWKNNHNASHNIYTTPADVYDRFIEMYGVENLFPVAKTEIGNLGAITCCECYFEELVRCTVLNGAEVICGPTASNLYTADKHKISMIQGHCNSNKAYWVRANIGGYVDSVVPSENYVGDSVIISHLGDRLCQANGSGEVTVLADIDINALRESRSGALTFGTFRAEMIGREFLRHAESHWPNNGFLEKPIASLDETKALQRKNIEHMYELGELERPFRPV
jgi:predicted amidohydrolase